MREIKMKINFKDVKAIFFSRNYHRILFGLYNKRQSYVLLIGIMVFPFFIYYSIKYDIRWLFIIGLIVYAKIIYEFWRATESVYKWRKSVIRFLKSVRKVKELTIQYDDLNFIHIQDGDELIFKWSDIKKAQFNEMCIWLHGDRPILLPRKSMTDSEYKLLSEMILEKVRNIEKE